MTTQPPPNATTEEEIWNKLRDIHDMIKAVEDDEWRGEVSGLIYADLLAEIRNVADDALPLAVELARSQREPWGSIGEAIGISRQSAWERFA